MSSFIIDILSDFLGDYHNHNESSKQVNYDCPSCRQSKYLKGLKNMDIKAVMEALSNIHWNSDSLNQRLTIR